MADLIVVGSGAAGLSAALKAAELGAHVALLTGGALLAGSSPRAQGGVAAAVGADDAPALHAADTLAVGGGLNDHAAVNVLTQEGSRSVQRLLEDGVPFDDDLGLEAGHQRRRIVHAGGAATGQVLTSALLDRASQHPRITLHPHTPADALLTHAGRVVGVHAGKHTFTAQATLLATGGYAALWGRTTNAAESRGTGLVLAYQAGASLADLEFVQFHPTALSLPGQPAFLLSEALRGEGARLLDVAGREVVDPLLPRDVVARALYRHVRAHGPVFLSLRHLEPTQIHERFANLSRRLTEFGLDLARDLLPVAPAAHYCMGGIRTDTWGRTDVRGLYAAGETACTGVQGANRLASNSLLECLVFGARAAEAALSDGGDVQLEWTTRALPTSVDLPAAHEQLAAIDPHVLGARLDGDVGVEREPHRLGRLVAELPDPTRTATRELPDPTRTGPPDQGYTYNPGYTYNVAVPGALDLAPGALDLAPGVPDLALAALVTRAAFLRQESRGAHFRTDLPDSQPAWRGRIHWRRGHAPQFEEVLAR